MKAIKKILILPLLLILLVSCSSASGLVRSVASLDGHSNLPAGIQHIIQSEQSLLSRDVNEDVISSPKLNDQDEKFKPENGRVFEVKSYWVNESDLLHFKSINASKVIMKKMYRKKEGVAQWRFLVHPESENYFDDFLKQAEEAEAFLATSTSSSRTLIVWEKENPKNVFFGKLSLDKKIGEVVRTIPRGEVARSIGTSNVLDSLDKSKLENFDYFPESIGLIPEGFERGGMIIREIPEKIKNGSQRYLPLFSLYAECGRCESGFLISDMINRSGLRTDEFIEKKILQPFVDQWIELTINQGITIEAHAQNVLIGVDSNEDINSKFLYRDFGGFNIDLELRESKKLTIPSLPFTEKLSEDYHQNFKSEALGDSILTYFNEGFVYNLDKRLSVLAQAGVIPDYLGASNPKYFRERVLDLLAKRLKVSKILLSTSEKSFISVIEKVKKGKLKNDFLFPKSCNQLLYEILQK